MTKAEVKIIKDFVTENEKKEVAKIGHQRTFGERLLSVYGALRAYLSYEENFAELQKFLEKYLEQGVKND